MDKIESILKIVASSLAIIIPAILLAGYSYHLGYSLTFGLSTDLISKNMSDVLAESWYVGVNALIWLISKWIAFLITVLMILVLYFIGFLWLRKYKEKAINFLHEIISRVKEIKLLQGIPNEDWVHFGKIISEIFTWLYYPFAILLIIIILFLAIPYESGKRSAENKIKNIQSNNCLCDERPDYCIYLIDTKSKNNTVVASGILVSANESRIAIYNEELEVWPMLDNYMISRSLMNKQDSGKSEKSND